ncbi:MAG TPA: hypothetical protein VE439_07530 [Anaerolineae bacterium]|jgi:DNA-binding MarR family transcriptional regulator|nr:hypothetical protein [Anaerolineae bacterium]
MSKTIDSSLKSFISSYVNSLASWAIIVFYHQNPGVRDRVSDLAMHLGRRENDIEKAVEHLTESGLLKKEEGDNGAIYIYEPDLRLREQVNAFVDALDVRELRLWVLSEVLGG